MSGDKRRSLHIFTARAKGDKDESRIWVPDGKSLTLSDHPGGYFTHAYSGAMDLDMSGVMSVRGKGSLTVKLEDGRDDMGRKLVEKWRQGRVEVVGVYREWERDKVWENNRTVTVWGYISGAKMQAGPSSLAFEVHCVRVITQNDATGTSDYSIDCINGASTLRGGSVDRKPEPISPVARPESRDWGKCLNGKS